MQEKLEEKVFLKDEKQSEQDELFGTPEVYDCKKFREIEGFELDDELFKKFEPIARKLNLSQKSIEMLLEIALEMSKKQNAKYDDEKKCKKENEIKDYTAKFSKDEEIPSKNPSELREYMRTADSAYREFASDDLKEFFKETNLIYHPEMIKMFHKIGELLIEDGINYGGKPSVAELSPADILYGER